MVKEIKEELDIPSNIMGTIVQTWVEGISEVMPKEVE